MPKPPHTRRHRAPRQPRVTITVTEVETLPPEQQAAWDWLVRRVQATMHRQAAEAAHTTEKEPPHAPPPLSVP